MKRIVIAVVVILSLILSIVAANQYAPYSANQKIIYQYLRNQMGLNQAVSCGVMANLYYESKYNPHLTGDHGTSYGICQWHNVRWRRMTKYCKRHNLDEKDLEAQLKFMNYELKHFYHASTYNKLIKLDNTEKSARKAGDIWCRYFERPALLEEQCEKRGNYAARMFFDLYDGSYEGQSVLRVKHITPVIRLYDRDQKRYVRKLIRRHNYTLSVYLRDNEMMLPVNQMAVYYIYEMDVIIRLNGEKVIKKHYDHEDTIQLDLTPSSTGELTITMSVIGDGKKVTKKLFDVIADD